jgi:hypothetical protein
MAEPNNKILFLLVVACALVFEFLVTASPAFAAGSEQTLYSFCSSGGSCRDGGLPSGGVVFDTAGDLYGTVGGGGARTVGARFLS